MDGGWKHVREQFQENTVVPQRAHTRKADSLERLLSHNTGGIGPCALVLATAYGSTGSSWLCKESQGVTSCTLIISNEMAASCQVRPQMSRAILPESLEVYS